jgi:hypothetical protein
VRTLGDQYEHYQEAADAGKTAIQRLFKHPNHAMRQADLDLLSDVIDRLLEEIEDE